MKRTERHHLKENEVAEWVLQLREQFESNKSIFTYTALAVLVVAVVVVGTLAWRSMAAGRGVAALAEAMTIAEAQVMAPQGSAEQLPVQPPGTFPTEKAKLEAALPKFLAVADTYPATESGMIARYRAAAAMVALGRTDDGLKAYQVVAEKGTGVLQSMARLGMADAQLAGGKYDAAVKTLTELAGQGGEYTPTDGVLMQLGRAYRLAGKAADAKKTFQRIVDEFPQSVYAAQANKELDTL